MARSLILFTRVLEDEFSAQTLEDEFNRLLSGVELAEGEKIVSAQYNELQPSKEYSIILTISQ